MSDLSDTTNPDQSQDGGFADKQPMIDALSERGLQRTAGMSDYVFVQQLSNKVKEHITYHAGKPHPNSTTADSGLQGMITP